MHYNSNNNKETMCTRIEEAKPITFEYKLRQYAALFDGSTKDFSDVEFTFNDLYHDDFLGTSKEEEINKQTRKELDGKNLAAGAKITNVAYTTIDYNKAIVEFNLVCEEGKSTINQYLITIKDKKIIEASIANDLGGVMKVYYLSDYY